ncbi:hypothetical protein PGH46_00035 [Legionella pneumophila]|nr:hypothetical protein PGH46_00035 [Legionella pneumophila]
MSRDTRNLILKAIILFISLTALVNQSNGVQSIRDRTKSKKSTQRQ